MSAYDWIWIMLLAFICFSLFLAYKIPPCERCNGTELVEGKQCPSCREDEPT